MWTRESEDTLLKLCLSAARTKRPPRNANEADVFRLVAQLVRTRHPALAANLNKTTEEYFVLHTTLRPRPFPEVVQAGLVRDLSRFRNLLERQLSGARTW